MNRLLQIRARLAEIAAEMRTLGDAETMTDEQATRFAELDTESQTLETEAGEIEARNARIEAVQQRVRSLPTERLSGDGATVEGDPLRNTDETREGQRRGAPWGERLSNARSVGDLRSLALDAAERMPSATDRVRSTLTGILQAFGEVIPGTPDEARAAETYRQVVVASDPAYMRAFAKLVIHRMPESSLTDEERQAYLATIPFVRAMSTADASGGYLIPQQLDTSLILTAAGSVNPVRRLARVVQATGDRWDGVSAGAASWSWDAEGTEVSDDSVGLGNPFVPIFTARGFIPYSHEVAQDASNWTENMRLVLMQGRDDLEATAHILGTGTGQPTGIVTALTGTSSVVASNGADTYAVGDVYKVHDALPARYRARAAWAMAQTVISLTRQFGTADSHALLTRLADGYDGLELLGRPLLEASNMDGAINATLDNYIAVFGDWSNYVIADRLGTVVEVIPHLFGANGRPTGQSGLYARFRSGADSVNDGAFRMLNVT